jgi:YesN/AraC family two-component response regulator
VLLSYDSAEAPSQDGQLIALVKEVQEKTYEFLKISLTATFSDTFETWGDLQSYYLNTLDLSYYRLILGHRSLIFGDSLQARTDEFKYQDKELTDALIRGRIDEAKEALSDIIRQASQYSLTTLNSVLIRLLLSIRSAVELLEANHAITVRFNINIYLSKLSKIETLEKILADFDHLFDDLALQLESKKENKYADLFDSVMQIIHKEYANPSLTLDIIAQKVNLSPSYLAKLFKKHHLISMNDFINDVRLQRASDLIITTDDTITAIMEKSGFSARSHFFTLFKKSYGLSPNQYRSQFRMQTKG